MPTEQRLKVSAVSYETYRHFAKKYGIRLTKGSVGNRVRISIRELSEKIKRYEKKHNIKDGLY